MDRSPGGPSRPETPLCHPGVGCGYGRVMWGAASFLFRCARCSGTPVWVRGSRSSRRSPYRVAVPSGGGAPPPALGGRRAAPVAPQLGWVRGGGDLGGRPSARSRACVGGGGGEWGGPFGPLATPPDGRGGGGRHGSPGPGGQPSAGGVAPFPRPPLPRAGSSCRPSLGPLIPRPSSRGAGRPGVAVRVSGQWLAGCGAGGSPPRSLSPHSLPREVARPLASCRTVGGAWVGGPSPPFHCLVSAVWAITCAAACVGAGAVAAAGCAGGSASGRGRCAKPGGASCWRPHP